MKKILSIMLAVLMMAFMFVSCGKTEADVEDIKYVQDKGELIIGITDYAPMNYYENGVLTGFDTEFAEAVAAKLGVKAKFVEIVWANKAMELETKNIDCVWNGMTITEDVKAAMTVSDAYVINAQVLVMKADKIGNYKAVEDLKDVVFVAEKGSAGAEAITNAGYTAVEVDTQSKALMEVAAGTADACVIDITMAKAMTGEGTDYADLTYGFSFTSEEYGIGFRKGSDLADKVNSIIGDLKKDGTLNALAEKYSLTLA